MAAAPESGEPAKGKVTGRAGWGGGRAADPGPESCARGGAGAGEARFPGSPRAGWYTNQHLTRRDPERLPSSENVAGFRGVHIRSGRNGRKG